MFISSGLTISCDDLWEIINKKQCARRNMRKKEDSQYSLTLKNGALTKGLKAKNARQISKKYSHFKISSRRIARSPMLSQIRIWKNELSKGLLFNQFYYLKGFSFFFLYQWKNYKISSNYFSNDFKIWLSQTKKFNIFQTELLKYLNGININNFSATANECWSKLKECLPKSAAFTLGPY